MNDETNALDPTSDDVTTGHVLHGEAAENPTTGGGAPGIMVRKRLLADGEDDVEGHLIARKRLLADDEDGTAPGVAR